MRYLKFLIAWLVMAGLTSCTQTAPDAQWTIPPVPTSVPEANSVILPFDTYRLSDSDRTVIQQKTAVLLQRCLARYSVSVAFAGDYIKQVPADGSEISYQWGGRLGTLEPDQASEYGYTAPPGTSWVAGHGFYLSDVANLLPVLTGDPVPDARVKAAMWGPEQATIVTDDGTSESLPADQLPVDTAGNPTPKGGCSAEVEASIDQPLVDLSQQAADAYGLSFAAPAVESVTKNWSSCMKAQGYDFSRFDNAASATAGAPNAANNAVAVADVRCTTESRWPGTFYTTLADYQSQMVKRSPTLFESALDAERSRLDRVNSLVG